MKKLLLAFVFGLLTLTPCFAQQGFHSHRFTIAGSDSAINLVHTSIAYHQITWNVSGTASVCTVALDTSSNGSTWSAGGVITGQTCTSNGSSTVVNVSANYVRINMTALTVTAGSSVTVTWDGYTSNPGGGGGTVTGTGAAGQGVSWSSTTAITGQPNTIDCTQFAGADLGAKWAACAAAAPAGSTISIANFPSPQVLSTDPDITNSVVTYCGGLTITQDVTITLSGPQTYVPGTGSSLVGAPGNLCTINKNANINQISLRDQGNVVKYLTLNGNGGSFTGDGINNGSNFGRQYQIEYNFIEGEAGWAIHTTGNAQGLVNHNHFDTEGTGGYLGSGSFDRLTENSGSMTSSAPVIHATSGSYLMLENNTLENDGAAPVVQCSGSTLTIHQNNLVDQGGYPAIADDSGSACHEAIVTGNWNIIGGGANGAAIDYANSLSSAGLVVSNNVNIMGKSGGDVIRFVGAQGSQVTNNAQITLDTTSVSGKCGVRILSGISGFISHNNVALINGSSAAGHNFGYCLTVVTAEHLNNNIVSENVVTGTGAADDFGLLYDNTADVVGSYTSGNIMEKNTFVDENTGISRIDVNNRGTNNYIQNQILATTHFWDAGGSNLDVINQNITGNSSTFTALPIAGMGSTYIISDSNTAIWGITIAGSGSNVVLGFNDGTNWTVMGK